VTVDVKGSPGEGPLESIDVTVSLDADADDETLDGIVTRGERTCYVERALGKMLVVLQSGLDFAAGTLN